MIIYKVKQYDSALNLKITESLNIVEIYTTACLTEKNGNFITLLAKQRAGLPGSVNLSVNNFKDTELPGNIIKLDLKLAKRWDSSIKRYSPLSVSADTTDAIKEVLDKPVNKINYLDLTVPGDAIANLLGKGPGLTPAGDDFIAGALNGAYCFNSALFNRLKSNIHGHLNKTTKLSRYYLTFAVSGRTGEDMLELLKSVSGNSVSENSVPEKKTDNIRKYTNRMMEYGASSGYYIVKGLLWALKKI
ncbi:MAG: DUF2877 domain-containing protein [Elusimicrobia bacterium]|jgi:hypothetical protein|nr:DUF2877 domain-containing protein [Elusimicrobiota bacterium]